MPQSTIEQLYARAVGRERETRYNRGAMSVFAVLSIPFGFFGHPFMFCISALFALIVWVGRRFDRSLDRRLPNFFPKMDTAIGKEACEFMLRVRKNGKDRSLLPLACADVIAAWWKTYAAFKPCPQRDELLRKDGTCAKCGGSEGWFESRM